MIFPLISVGFFLSLGAFLIAACISWFLPGFFVVRKFPIKHPAVVFLTVLATGITLWGIQAYVFGYLHVRWMTYVYLGIIIIEGFRERAHILHFLYELKKSLINAPKTAVILVLAGLILQLLPMFGSGVRYADGVRFYGINEHDAILHLSFIQSMIRAFPPMQPGAYDLPITHYHYWSDLVMAELSRIWLIPVSHLFFQFMPVVISLATSAAVYLVVRQLGGSVRTGIFALALLFLGSDMTYVFTLIFGRGWGFYTPALDNGVAQFLNMPYAMAKMLFVVSLFPLMAWLKTKKDAWLFLIVLLLAPLVGFKVYVGLFAAMGFTLVCLWKLVRRWDWKLVFTLGAFAIISAAIFFPPNASAGGLRFAPMVWPKVFLGEENINAKVWWLRHQLYEQQNNTIGMIALDSAAVVVSMLCIYGVRIVGAFPVRELRKNLGTEGMLFLFPGLIVFTILGFTTLQVSGSINVFNFFVVATIPLVLSAAFFMETVWKKGTLGRIVVVLFLLASLPRILHEIEFYTTSYLRHEHVTVISPAELEAFAFIRSHAEKNAIVQSHAGNDLDATTPYVSFFTNRSSYLSGVAMLISHNQPVEQRARDLQAVFLAKNSDELAGRLRERHVRILYLQKKGTQIPAYPLNPKDFLPLFENSKVVVYTIHD